MRYYGLKKKIRHEDFVYFYAKTRSKFFSLLPGKYKEFYKNSYEYCFRNRDLFINLDNSLPEGKYLKLNQIVTSDLVYREDIKKLQKGIRILLKKRRSNRFFAMPHDGLDEICSRIDKMDSTLLSWYEEVECGVFDFKETSLETMIDHFTVSIKNMNSSYLGLEFSIYLTEQKMQELNKIISCNYRDKRGYASSTLTSKSNGSGAFENYTVMHFNDSALKADKIYEFISYIEWEFYEELKSFFPFMLHRQGIMPPRIEVYYTDIDYRENHKEFWSSIGISGFRGQFIDDCQKVFFSYGLSGRYERYSSDRRLIYVIKDDGIEESRLRTVKDDVYVHIDQYAREYFRFLFLNILSKEAGKTVVFYKHKLDRVKLGKRRLKRLLKMKYQFSRDTDDFKRYVRDDNWEESIARLRDIYEDIGEMLKNLKSHPYISYEDFCHNALAGSEKIEGDIDTLLTEFESKEHILQTLSDYKNTAWGLRLNILMLFIAVVTLLLVIFPERAKWLAGIFQTIYYFIIGLFL